MSPSLLPADSQALNGKSDAVRESWEENHSHTSRQPLSGGESPLKGTELTPDKIEVISADGDVVLQIEDSHGDSVYYRVSSIALREASAYFDKLLDPAKFNEGERVARKLKELRNQYPSLSVVPTSALPQVFISDLCQFPKSVSNRSIFKDFFEILSFPGKDNPSLSRTLPMALLAVVADRFGATDSIGRYINRNVTRSRPPSTQEEVSRQRILVGLLLNIDDWATRYSTRLIMAGSGRWNLNEMDSQETNDLLWWNLPGDVEGRIIINISGTLKSLTDNTQKSLPIAVPASSPQSAPSKPISSPSTPQKSVNANSATTHPRNVTLSNSEKWSASSPNKVP